MPHHKSAAKRVKTNEGRRQRNIALTTKMRHALKAIRTAKSKPEAEALLKTTASVLDRTAAKGVIKRETASRHKSRLARFVAALPA